MLKKLRVYLVILFALCLAASTLLLAACDVGWQGNNGKK